MNFLEETTLTELETIQFAIRHRRTGAKRLLDTYMKHGKLQSSNSVKSLIKLLETLFDTVRVEGKGVNRKYILSGKKKRPSKKVTEYKGTVPTIDDETVKEYIMSQLVESKYTDGSYKYWSRVLGMPQESDLTTNRLERFFADRYNVNKEDEMHKYIVSQFNIDLNRRSKKYVETAFKNLKQEGRIKLNDTYYEVRKVIITNGYGEKEVIKATSKITKARFNEIQKWVYDECEAYGITKKQYTDLNLYPNMNYDLRIRQAKKSVDYDLLLQFGLYGIFKGVKVKVINNTFEKISHTKFYKSFFSKFLKNSATQYNEAYSNSPFESKAFYLYNNLLILSKLGIKGLDELINENKPTQKQIDKLSIMKMEYAATMAEKSNLTDRENMAF